MQLFPSCLYLISGAFSHFNSGNILMREDLKDPIGISRNLFLPAILHSSLNFKPNCLSTSSSVHCISFNFPSTIPIHCLPLTFVGQNFTQVTFHVSILCLTRYPFASVGTYLFLVHCLQSSTNISPNCFQITSSCSVTMDPSLVIPCQTCVDSPPCWSFTLLKI